MGLLMTAAQGLRGHRLMQVAGYTRAEFGYSTSSAIGELYRALAVACIEGQITRVLIVAGDDEPAGERALRDALTAMVLAGMPKAFRLALVAARPGVAHTYRNAPRDFTAAGIPTRLFDSEFEAVQWLRQGNPASDGSSRSGESADSRHTPPRAGPPDPRS